MLLLVDFIQKLILSTNFSQIL